MQSGDPSDVPNLARPNTIQPFSLFVVIPPRLPDTYNYLSPTRLGIACRRSLLVLPCVRRRLLSTVYWTSKRISSKPNAM